MGPDMAPKLDLKSSLTLRVAAVALFCFLIAAALALFGTYRDVCQLNEHVADILVRQLASRLRSIPIIAVILRAQRGRKEGAGSRLPIGPWPSRMFISRKSLASVGG